MKSMPRVGLVGLCACFPAWAESGVVPARPPASAAPSTAPSVESTDATEGPPRAAPSDAMSPVDGEGTETDGPTTDEARLALCVESHESAQLARLSGGLLRAREHLAECMMPVCPGALRSDCSQWSQELKAAMPTIVVHAVGDTGDIEDAVVLIDGEVARRRLDGLPIPLDPGTHFLRVEMENGERREQRIVVVEGAQGRRIELDFKTSPPPTPTPQDLPAMVTIRPVPILTYVLGGVALAGSGLGVGMGFRALSMSREAERTCAPLCHPDVGRAVKERAAVADIAWGISAGAIVGAALVYIYRPAKLIPAATSEGLAIDLAAAPGHANVVVGGVF